MVAFSDRLTTQSDYVERGFSSLVGDVSVSDAYLTFCAEANGTSNAVNTFNDRLLCRASDGASEVDDVALVGDVTFGAGSITLIGRAGVGGDGPHGYYNNGGDGNRTAMCNDRLLGGAGWDNLVGDVARDFFDSRQPQTADVDIIIACGADGDGRFGGEGGTGNEISAFNDTLLGGNGGDDMVGDIRTADSYVPSSYVPIDIDIEGTAGNRISAFRDRLVGGGGNDTLWGDFFDGYGGFAPSDLDIDGDFAGRALLFSDTLVGGGGNDLVAGGLGADQLTGGAGADSFLWDQGDLTAIAASGVLPVDTVTDFRAAGADVLDLRPLLASLGFDAASDAASDWLALDRDGGATVFAIDQTGGGHGFQDFLVLRNFLTDLTLDELIDRGTVLIG